MKNYRVQLLHKIEAEDVQSAVEGVIAELTSVGLSNLMYRVIEVGPDGEEVEYMASTQGSMLMEEALEEFFGVDVGEDEDDEEDEDETPEPVVHTEGECSRCHEHSDSLNERGLCTECVIDIVGSRA